MFKRRWLVFGRISSDEGFTISYGHKTLYYTDERGTFQIGYEDDRLFPASLCLTVPTGQVAKADRELILDRILRALEWDGRHPAVQSDPAGK